MRVALSAAVSLSPSTKGAMGDLDPTWGDAGRVRLVYPDNPSLRVELLDGLAFYGKSGGGLICVGKGGADGANMYAFNLTSQGLPDSSMVPGGLVNLGPQPNGQVGSSAGMDSEGRILGNLRTVNTALLFRLDQAGRWDPTFGVNGKLGGNGVLVFGTSGTPFLNRIEGYGMYRLLPSFFIDPSFGNNGAAASGGNLIVELSDSRLLVGGVGGWDFRSYLPNGQVDSAFNPTNGNGFQTIISAGQQLRVMKVVTLPQGEATLWGHNGLGQLESVLIRRDGSFTSMGVSPVLFDPALNNPVELFDSPSGRFYLFLRKGGKIVVLKPGLSIDSAVGNAGLVECDIGPPASPSNADWDGFVIPKATAGVGGLSNFFAIQPDSRIARYLGETDADNDGIPDRDESGSGTFVSKLSPGTRADAADSDGDGLSDGMEVYQYLTNPNAPDSDGDGFYDGFEVAAGYSPNDGASKPAALLQAHPAVELTLFTQIGKTYRIQYSEGLNEWHDTPETITGNGGVVDRLFQQTKNGPRRFWRAVEIGGE